MLEVEATVTEAGTSNFYLIWIPIYTALHNWPYFNLAVIDKLMINLRRAQKKVLVSIPCNVFSTQQQQPCTRSQIKILAARGIIGKTTV